ALDLVDVATASAVRMPLVSAILWLVALRAGVVPRREQIGGRGLLAIAATGALTVGTTVLFLESVALAGAGRAAVLTATSPIFGVPLSVLFFGERASGRLAVGALCSVAGVALLAAG
ncbi:MAG: EamA family transporter, partial [Chloroflexota bacterium]|nr:EamA family transporter [Chloroflexota bacterium]